jgi:hypothetical protein
MDLTRRALFQGLGAVSIGLLFRRQLDGVLASLEADAEAEALAAGQVPAAIEIAVAPQALFRAHRLVVSSVVVGTESVPEREWQPCAGCSGGRTTGYGDGCDACGYEGGSYVATGRMVNRELRSAPWAIQDITIGGRSQFTQGTEIPGDVFAPDSPDPAVILDAAPAGAEIRFRVRYTGTKPGGEPFVAALLGRDESGRMCVLPIRSEVAIAA